MASGDRTEKLLYGPYGLGTSNSWIVSPSAGYTWVIKQIIFCNTTGAEALIYMAIGSAAVAGNRFMSALPIAQNDTIVLDTALVLESSTQLYGYSDRDGINIFIIGWERQN
jgi:hypothetical protein